MNSSAGWLSQPAELKTDAVGYCETKMSLAAAAAVHIRSGSKPECVMLHEMPGFAYMTKNLSKSLIS